eukprot:1191417-Prorocentrum_minimum.AAC.1
MEVHTRYSYKYVHVRVHTQECTTQLLLSYCNTYKTFSLLGLTLLVPRPAGVVGWVIVSPEQSNGAPLLDPPRSDTHIPAARPQQAPPNQQQPRLISVPPEGVRCRAKPSGVGTGRQTDRQKDSQTIRHRQSDRVQSDKVTDRQSDRQTDKTGSTELTGAALRVCANVPSNVPKC